MNKNRISHGTKKETFPPRHPTEKKPGNQNCSTVFHEFLFKGVRGNEKNRGRLRIAALPASPTSLFKVTNLHV